MWPPEAASTQKEKLLNRIHQEASWTCARQAQHQQKKRTGVPTLSDLLTSFSLRLTILRESLNTEHEEALLALILFFANLMT